MRGRDAQVRALPRLRRPWFAPLMAVGLSAAGGGEGGPPSQRPATGPDPVELSAEVRELRELAADPDRAFEASLALTRIIEELDRHRDSLGELPEVEREIFLRAVEYRSRADLSRGSREPAADGFRLLLLADPSWQLDRTDLSAAVVDLFEQQRSALVAWLTVRTEPEGAEVLVGNELAGTTPLLGHPVHAGFLRVRLQRAGFATLEEPRREVLPGEIVTIERALERVGAVLPVVTSPPGVTVRVGGRVVGSTAGRLPDELRPLMPPQFAGDEFSAPLELGSLEPGPNEILFQAPCRRPARLTFHADEARDYLPQFVRLRPSTGGLRIESQPGGGAVFLNGEERGVTPLSFSAMCSGDHEVEIRHAVGRCARSFRVSRGARTAVRCEIRPVLTLTGGDPPTGAEPLVREVLRTSEAFYFLEGAARPEVQAELRIVNPDSGAGTARVDLFATGSSIPDTAAFDRFEPRSAVRAVEQLLVPPVRRRPWLGMTATVRRLVAEEGQGRRLEVSSVHPAGPALLAGIEPGDELRELGGTPVQDELGVFERIEAMEVGSSLDVLVRRGASDRLLRIEVAETPVLPSLSGRRCNRRLVELEADFAHRREDPGRRLEAAVCWILLGDPERAMRDHLSELGPPSATGIAEGTVLYYRGLALLALGERDRAREAFERAAEFPGATMVTHDGPRLAALARRRAAAVR